MIVEAAYPQARQLPHALASVKGKEAGESGAAGRVGGKEAASRKGFELIDWVRMRE